jgi:hypothetical protein
VEEAHQLAMTLAEHPPQTSSSSVSTADADATGDANAASRHVVSEEHSGPRPPAPSRHRPPASPVPTPAAGAGQPDCPGGCIPAAGHETTTP